MRADLATAYKREMTLAREREKAGDLLAAFSHLERAHILGQRNTLAHVRAHFGMLRIGLRRRDRREILGQMGRSVAALLFSRIWVPSGNTGGANVSATQPMPVPEDLRRLLDQ